MQGKLEANRLEKDAMDVPRLLGGKVLGKLAMLNITVEEGQRGTSCPSSTVMFNTGVVLELRRRGSQGWCWSLGDAQAPQQRRGSDCGLFTLLYVIFQARGWDIQHLGSLAPKAMRGWFLRVLNSQGQWTRM